MEWWDKVMLPMRRVLTGVASRLGMRKSGKCRLILGPYHTAGDYRRHSIQGGLLKLRHDVRTCEYEDVRVMWEMLKRTETEVARSPARRKKRPYWNIFEWARRAPYLCRSF